MPVPQTVTNTLINDINEALFQHERPQTFTMKKWERDAIALTKNGTTAADGYQLLGILAVFRMDLEEIDSNFRKALKLSRNSSRLLENFAAAFLNSMASAKALSVLDEFDYRRHTGIEAAQDVSYASSLAAAGRVREALDLCGSQIPEGEAMHSNRGGMTTGWLKSVQLQLDRFSLTESHYIQWVQCADGVLSDYMRKLGVDCWQLRPSYDSAPEFGGSITYLAPISVDDAVEVNFALADALAALDVPTVHGFPIISVMPYAD